MMKVYETYKDSRIDWVGLVPLNWRKLKLGRSFNIIGSGTTPNTNNEIYYSNANIDWLNTGDLNDSEIYLTKKKISQIAFDDLSTLRLFPIDSIVIALYGATIGKIGHLKIECTTNQACCVLSESDDVINRFLFYYFMSAREFIISKAYGGGQPNISQDLIKQLQIATPSKQEQLTIVNFLDYQTSLIDTIISKKEKLIELLKEKRQAVINEAVTKGLDSTAKMKDSGIEWLGEIPEGWKVIKLKQIADAFGRIGYRGYTTEDIVENGKGAITISPSNMKGDFMTFENCTYINWHKYDESPEIKIFNNDILIVKTGSTYGKIGLVKDLSEKATINPQLLVLKNLKINSEYLFNLLRTPFIQQQVETNVVGSTIPTISQTKILNFQLPIPPLDQLDNIVEHMNRSMNKIDLTVQIIFNQIEKLKQYRQSLISEAVTGKIDVREWEPKNIVA